MSGPILTLDWWDVAPRLDAIAERVRSPQSYGLDPEDGPSILAEIEHELDALLSEVRDAI